MVTNQQLGRLSACLAVAGLTGLTALSLPALAQSRACVIDERNGTLHCGYPADPYGNRIVDVPPGYAAPGYVAPGLGYERRDERPTLAQAQERVNRLYREVLGRSADYTSLRQFADQVVDGRDLSDVRIELATSPEAREAIKRIYREVLGREADPSGLEAQINELRRGQSLSEIRATISRSPEARNRR
ncbi:MAG: hypothetical protein ABIO88_12805 [Burkholderiaceae bacterium]